MKKYILLNAELLNILKNDKWILSDKEFDDHHNANSNNSDDDNGKNDLINKDDDLQNIVITDFVNAEGNEVGEVLSEAYHPKMSTGLLIIINYQ